MGETVVFLSRPGRCFNVVDRSTWSAPAGFEADFHELAVLNHHGSHDAQE